MMLPLMFAADVCHAMMLPSAAAAEPPIRFSALAIIF